jgi:cytidyltransferase-like protein
MIRGIVSGYFNPLHKGHLEYIHAAKIQCDYLIVIVNNDAQVKLKGSKPFMDQDHRRIILSHIRDVDQAIIAIDTEKTVCQTLLEIRKKYPEDDLEFYNSGDRAPVANAESAEMEICRKNQIKYVAIPLPKVYSSSTLLAEVSK